jgi:hypothetical protein
MVGGRRPAVRETAYHPVKMYLATREDDQDIARMITRVFQAKADDRRLTVQLFDCLERKLVRANHIGL